MEKRYTTFSAYLEKKYGVKTWKIPVHAGMNCPNRDGTKGTGGCIFCNNNAFHSGLSSAGDVNSQINQNIIRLKQTRKAEAFLIYFQTFSNTYASIPVLKKSYDQIFNHDNVVGIVIGTRPDCVNEEILDLLSTYAERYDVWIEYGLQTINNETLKRINRNHSAEDFFAAVELTRPRPLNICVHLLFGLPGENREDMLHTVESVSKLPVHGIKFHPLQVFRETQLADQYKKNEFSLLEMPDYCSLVCDAIERLPESVIVQRLTADADDKWLIAPEWCRKKAEVINEIDNQLCQRNSRQGLKFYGI